jgi:type II secretory pathway pseudopilin PulG
MLAVLAIIMLLVGMLAGVAARITTQGKERLTRDTIALIGNALEQFRDFDYKYKDPGFAGLTFPLDCNGFIDSSFTNTIEFAQGLGVGTVTINSADPNQRDNSGSEALYFFLNQVPDCRKTLDKIDKSLISNKTKNGVELQLVINGVSHPLYRFIDPWGTALRYDYYDEWQNDALIRLRDKKTFPLITSAGADRRFGTNDDISNIQAK